jgi:hypothetical protein
MRSVLAAVLLFAFGAYGDDAEINHPLVVLGQDPVIALAESPRGAHVQFEVHAYGGRDPHPVVRCDPPSGSLFPFGPSHVQCTATNSFGERASGGVYIFVYDGTQPVLEVPDDIFLETEDDGAVVEFAASANDAVDGPLPVTCTPESGSRFPLGQTLVECSAIDSYGNGVSEFFTVTVRHPDEPTVLLIQVPETLELEATSRDGATVDYEVTTYGSTDPNPSVTCDPASRSRFPIGTTTVLCNATDSFGNRAEGTFEVNVRDTTAPLISGMADLDVEATSSSGAVVTFSLTATDAVDGDVEVTCTPASGSEFPIGQTVVQCTADDSRGNTGFAGFTVTVHDSGEGGSMLFLQVPSTIEAEATSSDGATVEFEVTTTGSTDPSPAVTCSPASGSTFAPGTTDVLCVATDTYGNRAEGTFQVVVGDTVAPMIVSISATPDVLAPANHKLVDVTVTVDATDSVDPMPQCYAYDVTANEAVDAPGSGDTEYDWILTGPLSVQLRAERSGEGNDRIYNVLVRCSDASGNEISDGVEVRVPKTASGEDATIATPKRRRSVGRR